MTVKIYFPLNQDTLHWEVLKQQLSWTNSFRKWLFRFVLPPAIYKNSSCPTSLQIITVIVVVQSPSHLWLLQPYSLLPARFLCPWDFSTVILDWVAIPFSRGSSQPSNETHVSSRLSPALHADSLPTEPPGKPIPAPWGPHILIPQLSSVWLLQGPHWEECQTLAFSKQ